MPNRVGAALASARLAAPPNLDDQGWEWASQKRTTQGYVWGAPGGIINSVGANIINTATWEGAGDYIRLYPQVFPRSGLLSTLVWYLVTDMVAGQAVRMAIYDDTGNLYPANKVYDTGSMTLLSGSSSNGHGRIVALPALRVAANSVLWMAWNFNQAFSPSPPGADNEHIVSYDALGSQALLGYDYPTQAQMVSNNRFTHGWILSSAYASGMPTPFTAGAILHTYSGVNTPFVGQQSARNIPLWLFGFTADT